jgi:uncharacterized protein (TIGR00369 family)
MAKPNAAQLQDFLNQFTRGKDGEPRYLVDQADAEQVRLRMPTRRSHLRLGDTVGGPVQMTLVDVAAWALVLHHYGLPAAASVTSSLNINFLSRPAATDMTAEARALKLGKRLCVSEVRLFSAGQAEPVAQATVTYSVRSAAAHDSSAG